MVAVGADDEVALELVHLAVLRVDDRGSLAGDADGLDVLGLEHDARAEPLVLGEQVGDERLLPVDRDGAADELLEVDVVALPLELQVDAVVGEAALAQPGVEPELGEDVDRPLLEHAGADAAEHVLARRALEDRERRPPPGRGCGRAAGPPGPRR